jgi:hypothetical protein
MTGIRFLTAILLATLLTAALSGNGNAEQKSLKDLAVGTWTLVSGSAIGADAKGMMVLDAKGNMSIQIIKPGRPKFAANNRTKGTPEENSAAVQGMISYFGRWSVDEPSKTLILHIDYSSYPNSDGTEQKRPLTVTADELRNTNPAPSGGTPPADIIWKRVN